MEPWRLPTMAFATAMFEKVLVVPAQTIWFPANAPRRCPPRMTLPGDFVITPPSDVMTEEQSEPVMVPPEAPPPAQNAPMLLAPSFVPGAGSSRMELVAPPTIALEVQAASMVPLVPHRMPLVVAAVAFPDPAPMNEFAPVMVLSVPPPITAFVAVVVMVFDVPARIPALFVVIIEFPVPPTMPLFVFPVFVFDVLNVGPGGP